MQYLHTKTSENGYLYVQELEQQFPRVRIRIAGKEQGNHNFFMDNPEAKRNVCNMLGVSNLNELSLPDEKGSNIAHISRNTQDTLKDTSGLVATESNIPLVVRSGDAPLLFGVSNKAVGLGHITVMDIAKKLPERLAREILTLDENSHFVIGPGIQVDNYPVKWRVALRLWRGVRFKGFKPHLDLFKLIHRQLGKAGVHEDHIMIIDECMHGSGKYFSKRRREAEGDTRVQGNAAYIKLI